MIMWLCCFAGFTNNLLFADNVQEISKPNTVKHRLKHINQLCDIIQNKHLEQVNAAAALTSLHVDLLLHDVDHMAL